MLASVTRTCPNASPGCDRCGHQAENLSRRHQERREWIQEHGKPADPTVLAQAFRNDVLPLLAGVPIATLKATTGLTAAYLSQIRAGRQAPHPRHWPALIQAGQDEQAAPPG